MYKFKKFSAIYSILREINFVSFRYQDTDAFFDSSTGMPATNAQKAAAVMMLEENTHIVPGIPEYPFCLHLAQSQLIVYNLSFSAGTPNTGTSAVTRRLTQDSLKHEKIKKCTVIMPKLDLGEVKVWCLYHLQHDCPCHQLKNPLDYGPDINKSRNVAKRTLGNNFKTKKLEKTPRNRYEKLKLFFLPLRFYVKSILSFYF